MLTNNCKCNHSLTFFCLHFLTVSRPPRLWSTFSSALEPFIPSLLSHREMEKPGLHSVFPAYPLHRKKYKAVFESHIGTILYRSNTCAALPLCTPFHLECGIHPAPSSLALERTCPLWTRPQKCNHELRWGLKLNALLHNLDH